MVGGGQYLAESRPGSISYKELLLLLLLLLRLLL